MDTNKIRICRIQTEIRESLFVYGFLLGAHFVEWLWIHLVEFRVGPLLEPLFSILKNVFLLSRVWQYAILWFPWAFAHHFCLPMPDLLWQLYLCHFSDVKPWHRGQPLFSLPFILPVIIVLNSIPHWITGPKVLGCQLASTFVQYPDVSPSFCP